MVYSTKDIAQKPSGSAQKKTPGVVGKIVGAITGMGNIYDDYSDHLGRAMLQQQHHEHTIELHDHVFTQAQKRGDNVDRIRLGDMEAHFSRGKGTPKKPKSVKGPNGENLISTGGTGIDAEVDAPLTRGQKAAATRAKNKEAARKAALTPQQKRLETIAAKKQVK